MSRKISIIVFTVIVFVMSMIISVAHAATWHADWQNPGLDGAGRTGWWDFSDNQPVRYILDGFHPNWNADQRQQFENIVSESFSEWDKLISNTGQNPTFERAANPAQRDISIQFRDLTGLPINGDTTGFSMPFIDMGMPQNLRQELINLRDNFDFQECQIYLNSAPGINWFLDINNNPPIDQIDTLSIIKHEIWHKLGGVGHPNENINGLWQNNEVATTQNFIDQGERLLLNDWDAIMLEREIPYYDTHFNKGFSYDYVATRDPEGSSPLAFNSNYRHIADDSVKPDNPLILNITDGLWLAHGNTFIKDYYKIVTWDMIYNADKKLNWDKNTDRGAGFFEWGGVPTFDVLKYINDEVNGQPKTYHLTISLQINRQPDWEWIYLNDEPGQITITSLSMSSDCYPVPEPFTLLLLGSGLAGLVVFRRKRLFKKTRP